MQIFDTNKGVLDKLRDSRSDPFWKEIVELLRSGGVLVFPTETSYGIGCDATNDAAVAKVFAAKNRPDGKGTPVLVSSVEQAERYVMMSPKAKKLAEKYWPGALNLVLPVREMLHHTDDRPYDETSDFTSSRCATDGTQSVRVSSHPFVQELFKHFDRPIVATSANPSGSDALYDVSHLEGIFGDRAKFIDGAVDIGPLPIVPASTTIRVTGDQIEILRHGSIKL